MTTAELDWTQLPHDPAFERVEYEARIARVRQNMRDAQVDVVVVSDFCNLFYLTGLDSISQYDFQCVVLPLDAEPTVVINEFHEGVYQHVSGYFPVRTFSEFDDPVDVVTAVVRSAAPHGTVAIEDNWPSQMARISTELSGGSARVVEAFGLVERARLVKSAAEIALMTEVAGATEAGASAAMAAIAEGAVDRDIAEAATSAMLRAGSDLAPLGPIVCGGYRGGIPYSTFNGYRLQRGDAVFVELTGSLRRYVAPLMRSATVGEPSSEVAVAARVTSRAVDTILATARAGVSSKTVADAAMAVLQEGLDGRAFHHIIGYPVGIAYPPAWVERLGHSITVKSDFELESGMVFHLPMSLRKPGGWAIGLSQTIVIGENGATSLGTSPAALAIKE